MESSRIDDESYRDFVRYCKALVPSSGATPHDPVSLSVFGIDRK